MNKRGQITIFMIIGVLIVSAIFSVLIFNSLKKGSISNKQLYPEIQEIQDSMESCVNERAIDAVRLIGFNGGHITIPKENINTEIGRISYGYLKGENILPNKQEIENEISSYIKESLPFCLNESRFSDKKITFQNTNAKTKIEDFILIETTTPISLIENEQAITSDMTIAVTIELNFNKILETSNKIVESQKNTKEYVSVNTLAGLDKDVYFDFIDENNVLFIISDDNTKLNDIKYTFAFAVNTK